MPHHWLGKRIEIPLSADTRRLRMDRISTFTTGLDCRLYSRPSSEGPSIFSISFKLSVPAIAVTFFKNSRKLCNRNRYLAEKVLIRLKLSYSGLYESLGRFIYTRA